VAVGDWQTVGGEGMGTDGKQDFASWWRWRSPGGP